jgi:hypothetical protein
MATLLGTDDTTMWKLNPFATSYAREKRILTQMDLLERDSLDHWTDGKDPFLTQCVYGRH